MTHSEQSTLHKIKLFLLTGFFFIVSSQQVFAGGGSITPINFADSQQVTGKSFSPVVAVKDPASNYSSPWVGKEFSIQAHGDLAGASCSTTQRVSDSQGQIKADCHADAYGNFAFDIVDSSGGNNGTFRVIFVEPGQGSGSGFNEQSPSGEYVVTIISGNKTVMPNQVFYVESQLKKDGQPVSNYDDVDYFRWEVLQGSMVIVTSNHLNQNPGIKVPDLGKTVIRCTAIMKNGKTYESGAVTITVAWPTPSPVPTPAATSQTTPAPEKASPKSAQNSPSTPTPATSPVATPKASTRPSASSTPVASDSASATPSAVQAPAPEVVYASHLASRFSIVARAQNLAKIISNFFTHIWKR